MSFPKGKANDSIVFAQHRDEIAVCAPIGIIRSGFGGYMPEIVLFATIWRAPGWPTEAILDPKKAQAGQPPLDRTSVFPREN